MDPEKHFSLRGRLILLGSIWLLLIISVWFYFEHRINTHVWMQLFDVRNENLIFFRWIWVFNITALCSGVFIWVVKSSGLGAGEKLSWWICFGCCLFFLSLLGDLAELRSNWKYSDSHLSFYHLWIRYLGFGFLAIPLTGFIISTSRLRNTDPVYSTFGILFLIVFIMVLLSSEVTHIYHITQRDLNGELIAISRRVPFTILWTTYAAVLIVIGLLKKRKEIRLAGILLAGIVLLKFLFYDQVVW